MFTHQTSVRVRYAETDQMGFVYYGNYAAYYEVARVEALRSIGLTYKKMEAEGIIMPVTENKSKYMRPARYDDLLDIRLFVKEMPVKRIRFYYEIFSDREQLIHIGETELAFLDKKSGKPRKAPGKIIDLLKPFFNVQEH